MRDCSFVDHLWLQRCRDEYNIDDYTNWKGVSSYYQLYSRILYRYGPLLGVWQRRMGCYGGLISIKAYDGKIFGQEYVVKCYDSNPTNQIQVVRRPVFVVTTTDNEEDCVVQCQTLLHENHPGSIDMKAFKNGLVDKFSLACNTKCRHNPLENNDLVFFFDSLYQMWAKDELQQDDIGDNHTFVNDVIGRKFLTYLSWSHGFTFTRLSPIQENTPFNEFLQSGYYAGTYGIHGLEIIRISCNYKERTISGIKVTGDSNVPAGKVTFKAFLDNPISVRSSEDSPILLPDDLIPFGNGIPRYATAVYHGSGQIAFNGYRLPRFINGKFIVFDRDTCGFAWLGNSFTLFKRLDEEFLNI